MGGRVQFFELFDPLFLQVELLEVCEESFLWTQARFNLLVMNFRFYFGQHNAADLRFWLSIKKKWDVSQVSDVQPLTMGDAGCAQRFKGILEKCY